MPANEREAACEPGRGHRLHPRSGRWQSAVVYAVYPRSFADGDGTVWAASPGLFGRLPYIAALGVEGILMTPFQPSPHLDQGHDAITDYCGADPLFGTMEKFDSLLMFDHSLARRILLIQDSCGVPVALEFYRLDHVSLSQYRWKAGP